MVVREAAAARSRPWAVAWAARDRAPGVAPRSRPPPFCASVCASAVRVPDRRTLARATSPVPWSGGNAVRDHRRRPGRQHGRHLRRPARRRGHAGRARHRRRRRPPVGLHPVEDDDRHRRGDDVLPADRRAWASTSRRRASTSTASRGRIEGIEAQLHTLDRRAAREPGRADDQGHGAARRARTRSWSRPTTASRSSRPTPILLSTGSPAPHPRLVHARRRAHPHDPRLLPAAELPEHLVGDRLGRHRRGVRAHVLVVRLEGDAGREPPAGAARRRTPRWRPRSRTTSCGAASRC